MNKFYMSKKDLSTVKRVMQNKLDYMWKGSPQDKADKAIIKSILNVVSDELRSTSYDAYDAPTHYMHFTDAQFAVLSRLSLEDNLHSLLAPLFAEPVVEQPVEQPVEVEAEPDVDFATLLFSRNQLRRIAACTKNTNPSLYSKTQAAMFHHFTSDWNSAELPMVLNEYEIDVIRTFKLKSYIKSNASVQSTDADEMFY